MCCYGGHCGVENYIKNNLVEEYDEKLMLQDFFLVRNFFFASVCTSPALRIFEALEKI